MDGPAEQRDFLTALAALTSAYNDVTRVLEEIPDLKERFDAATVLGDLMRGLASDAATHRVRAAGRLHEEEELSLTKLADRLNLGSKALANNLVRSYRRQERDREQS